MENSTPSESFPSFLKLPFEIRSKIWSNTLAPRTIAVLPEYLGHIPRGTSSIWTNWKLRIRATPIAILQVCHEARAEALRRYTRLGNSDNEAGIYVDFSRDTLYLAWTHIRPFDLCFPIAADFFLAHRQKVQSLAMDIFYLADGVREALIELEDFQSLRELIFVVPPPQERLTKPLSESSGIVLKDIQLPYHSSHIEFDRVFGTVCLFYRNFLRVCKLIYLAESYEIQDQLIRQCSTDVHFRHSLNGDVRDIERVER